MGTDLLSCSPAPCVHFPSQSSAGQMLLLDLGTQTHFPSLSLHGTYNSLDSCSHISILEGESKCISCSWVNHRIQVWPACRKQLIMILCLESTHPHGRPAHILSLSWATHVTLRDPGLCFSNFVTQYVLVCVCVFVQACSFGQSCLTLCDPMDCNLLGSSVHGILQAEILEWVAMIFSGASSRPRDQTSISCVSCISSRILYH